MIYSPRIQKAINFSIRVHWSRQFGDKLFRKGTNVPYITHPLAVGLILSQAGANEDVICAGILHDTIEDCSPYGTVSRSSIARMFGDDVARMVDDVTEQDKSLPWLERKLEALKHIEHMEHDSLLVKSADVLHNLSELVQDVEKDGDKVFAKFNASKEDTLTRYKKLVKALSKAWKANPLLPEIDEGVRKLIALSE